MALQKNVRCAFLGGKGVGTLRATSPTHRAIFWWATHRPGRFVGHRDPSSKLFMRTTTLSDCAILALAAWMGSN